MTTQDFPVPAETAKAPAGSVARLIQVAKSQVGYIEGPKDNETKYGAFTKANFQPWCGSFVNWCGNEASVKIPNTVYTPGGAAAFKKAGAWIDGDIADPEPGDIAYFDFPSDGVDRISHVGIVIEDNEDNFVLLRKIKQGYRFLLLDLDDQSLSLVQLSQYHQMTGHAQPAASK
jgi:cell wall-associated NlpC family hydrolase